MENLRTSKDSLNPLNLRAINAKRNAEKMFERAIEKANASKSNEALEAAREALIFAKQNNLYETIYINSFMAVLSLESNKFGAARLHTYNATNKLNPDHYNYNTDKQYLEALLKMINKKDRQPMQLYLDSLAA